MGWAGLAAAKKTLATVLLLRSYRTRTSSLLGPFRSSLSAAHAVRTVAAHLVVMNGRASSLRFFVALLLLCQLLFSAAKATSAFAFRRHHQQQQRNSAPPSAASLRRRPPPPPPSFLRQGSERRRRRRPGDASSVPVARLEARRDDGGGGDGRSRKNGDGDGDDVDFSSWIQGGLNQWPLRQKSDDDAARTASEIKPRPEDEKGDEGRRNNRKAEEAGDVDGEDDFSAWIQQGIGQWPLRPDSGVSKANRKKQNDDVSPKKPEKQRPRSDDSNSNSQKKKKSPQETNPLVNLLDIDAILSLVKSSNGTTTGGTGARGGGKLVQQPAESLLSSVSASLDALISIDAILRAGETVLNNITSLDQLGINLRGLQKTFFGNDGGGGGGRDGEKSGDGAFGAEGLLKLATAQIESILADATSALSPLAVQEFVVKASEFLVQSEANVTDLVQVAKDIAVERGLDAREAANRVQETIEFSTDLVTVADGVMRKGYVRDGDLTSEREYLPESVPSMAGSRALFADFRSATEINDWSAPVVKAGEMGTLAGAIYEYTVPRTLQLGHAIVAEGMTEDIKWMVTDSIATESSFVPRDFAEETTSSASSEPFLLRTITLRGFDASDEGRERLLNRVVNASPAYAPTCKDLAFHSGLLDIAISIYKDTKRYMDWAAAPNHKIVLNGHSIGGSLSLMLLFLLTLDMGAEFVRDNVLRVFTFGSPPIVRARKGKTAKKSTGKNGVDFCQILETLGLPCTMVEGYVQPWDPIVRWFTNYDPIYPFVDDISEDGVTVWASGPPRTLRPLIKSIAESWVGWPQFRDTLANNGSEQYSHVGVQHVMVPEPARYLADRFVAVNIPVPPVEAIVRISSEELLPALNATFPLDEFEISFIPQTIRSFVHHFYPAYGFPMTEYVKRLEKRRKEKKKESKTSKIVAGLERT